MLAQQQSIMAEQGDMFGNAVDAAVPGRVALAVYRTFVENSTPSFDYGGEPGGEPTIQPTFGTPSLAGIVSLELLLASLGLAVLIRRAWATARNGGRHGVEWALLWWLASYFIIIGANLNLDWPRYYVPTAFFGSLLLGLGVQAIAKLARRSLSFLPGAPAVRRADASE